MMNRWILSPFFLDAPAPSLEPLARPGWFVNRARQHAPAAAALAPGGGEPVLPVGSDLDCIGEIHKPLVDEVAQTAAKGDRAVIVGGDCMTPIAALAGLQRASLDPVIVWLDAHGDFNTHETTLSGFVGGMPLAMITGRGRQALVDADGLTPLPDSSVILSDARDLDPPERALLDESGVTRTHDLDAVVDFIAGRRVHVHFDTDVVNLAEAPAVLYPVPGGPTVDELCAFAVKLRARAHLVSASMTTWSFDRDADGRTAAASWRVFREIVGDI
jgi:arginase